MEKKEAKAEKDEADSYQKLQEELVRSLYTVRTQESELKF